MPARAEDAGHKRTIEQVLTINCGSSSLKFAVYSTAGSDAAGAGDARAALRYAGEVERIGSGDALLHVTESGGQSLARQNMALTDHTAALHAVLDWLEGRPDALTPDAVGHRIVHGGSAYDRPQPITPRVIETLRQLAPLAPLHMPIEIAAIEALQARYPTVPQVACFDTAFHRTMPRVAQIFGLPRPITESGVLRYGFHGLSYEYILSELGREASDAGKSLEAYAGRRIVIAHLGNGASMVAIRDGRSVDTTMGLTPIGGLVMGARSGDLDPGVLLYLLDAERMSAADLRKQVEQEGGLLGVSGSSSDMRDLLSRMADDSHAEEAVDLFCYTARKYLGALVSVLGGIDTLVFTGGIGEHAAEVRRRICSDLAFLGIRLEPTRNDASARIISEVASPVAVRVMHTNEEEMIARHTVRILHSA